ncbi:unnamed protein product [Amoebophrya sp. A25]|nr:unnamed protein product [Amoebophrya sp. A25]|eukprot:GSA25T00019805001.1
MQSWGSSGGWRGGNQRQGPYGNYQYGNSSGSTSSGYGAGGGVGVNLQAAQFTTLPWPRKVESFVARFMQLVIDARQEELAQALTIRGEDWSIKQELAKALKQQSPTAIENAVIAYFNSGGAATSFFTETGPLARHFEEPTKIKRNFVQFLSSYLIMLKLYCEGIMWGLTPKAKPIMTESLEYLQTCLKEWSTIYCATRAEYETHVWMVPSYQYLLSFSREQAVNIDAHFNTADNENVNKLVETLRKVFAEMVRERQKRAGFLATTTELVRCCLSMFQITLVENVLKNVQQAAAAGGAGVPGGGGAFGGNRKGLPGFPTVGVPPSVSVTLAYYWGVVLVQSAKYSEAEGKIAWGYSQLVKSGSGSFFGGGSSSSGNGEQHLKHRRQMLFFLIPLRIRQGELPKRELLKMYDLESTYGKIVEAIRSGDLVAYEQAAKEQTLIFVKLGIVNLMSQVKHIVTRQFLRKIVENYIAELDATTSERAKSVKLSLGVVAKAFMSLAPHFSATDVEDAIAQQIAYGGIKGYLSVHHGKLVVPRTAAFPSIPDFSDALEQNNN